jgi:hypothetical protein
MTVEIYLCKPGQPLKEGRMVTAADIDSKAEAEADALAQVRRDPSLGKIAYYKIAASGDFKLFYTYTNPKAGKAPPPRGAGGVEKARTSPPTQKPPPGMWARLKALFGG